MQQRVVRPPHAGSPVGFGRAGRQFSANVEQRSTAHSRDKPAQGRNSGRPPTGMSPPSTRFTFAVPGRLQSRYRRAFPFRFKMPASTNSWKAGRSDARNFIGQPFTRNLSKATADSDSLSAFMFPSAANTIGNPQSRKPPVVFRQLAVRASARRAPFARAAKNLACQDRPIDVCAIGISACGTDFRRYHQLA